MKNAIRQRQMNNRFSFEKTDRKIDLENKKYNRFSKNIHSDYARNKHMISAKDTGIMKEYEFFAKKYNALLEKRGVIGKTISNKVFNLLNKDINTKHCIIQKSISDVLQNHIKRI